MFCSEAGSQIEYNIIQLCEVLATRYHVDILYELLTVPEFGRNVVEPHNWC